MNTIQNLTNQNNAIYNSLCAKNIAFTRSEINDNMSVEEMIDILTIENKALKELSKNNKPVQVKEPKKQPIVQNETKKCDGDEDENNKEESYEDPVKKFSTITNLEDIKRAFFNGEYEQFETLIKTQVGLKYYFATYNYASDKDGCPEFIAKNLVKGFVRNLDDFRKYFIIAFRCFSRKEEGIKKYSYPSLWILNSNDGLGNIIGSLYEDFTFVEEMDISLFLREFRKINVDNENDDTNLLDEAYLH
jgi:hypothetical protein